MNERHRIVAAAGIGAALEVFEFTLYGIFARSIGATFFPSTSSALSTLAAFAAFAVAFIARPVGAVVFGHLGDSRGRKVAMSSSILLMSGATGAIGLIPGHATIGIAAPVLLVLARCLQGFALAGEVSGVTTFLVEYGDPARRGRSASVVIAFFFLGNLLGVFTGLAIETGLSGAAATEWGWRIGFLMAFPLGLVGLFIRLRLHDTPAFRAIAQRREVQASPVGTALRTRWGMILLVAALYAGHTVSNYFLNTFMVHYLQDTLAVGRQAALISATAAVGGAAISAPFWGALADRVGFKNVVIVGYAALLLGVWPMFLGLRHFSGSLAAIVAIQATYGIAFGAVASSLSVLSVTLFPASIRYSGSALGYNLATTILGGTAAFVGSGLVIWTGNVSSPAFYMAGVVACSLAASVFLLRERDVQVDAGPAAAPVRSQG